MVGPSVLAKRSKQDQQTEGDSDTLEVEEEILQQRPPELTDTGQMRQKVKQLVSTSKGNTCYLKLC